MFFMFFLERYISSQLKSWDVTEESQGCRFYCIGGDRIV